MPPLVITDSFNVLGGGEEEKQKEKENKTEKHHTPEEVPEISLSDY